MEQMRERDRKKYVHIHLHPVSISNLKNPISFIHIFITIQCENFLSKSKLNNKILGNLSTMTNHW